MPDRYYDKTSIDENVDVEFLLKNKVYISFFMNI
jgi:hypothetical protein